MLKFEDIRTIQLIDDDAESRRTYGYAIEDAELKPAYDEGPLGVLDDYLTKPRRGEAALCDFTLSAHNYARFTGAELCARWYKLKFPALLCTRYEKVQIERIRPYRRWIPELLTPDELNPESLVKGLQRCLSELQGEFIPPRRPWRTLVHFLDNDTNGHEQFFVEVPAWSTNEIIRVHIGHLPQELGELVQPGYMCHAVANLGAEDAESLYLCEWELL